MNKGNFKEQAVFQMNLNMGNIWVVRENGTSRKQGENIPGGHSRNVTPRGNRRYGLREIVKDIVIRDFLKRIYT